MKLQKRAARVGFDWNDPLRVLDKLEEEMAEIKEAIESGNRDAMEDELGDLMFVCANIARQLDLDPGTALRRANKKFEHRFRAMERQAGDAFAELDLEQKEVLWQQVKRQQQGDAG